jgi:hypothetical protein
MNNRNTYTTRILNLLVRFFGTMLIATFIIPDVAVCQTSPASVNLGTAGNFVLLAKTGISTTGTTKNNRRYWS